MLTRREISTVLTGALCISRRRNFCCGNSPPSHRGIKPTIYECRKPLSPSSTVSQSLFLFVPSPAPVTSRGKSRRPMPLLRSPDLGARSQKYVHIQRTLIPSPSSQSIQFHMFISRTRQFATSLLPSRAPEPVAHISAP